MMTAMMRWEEERQSADETRQAMQGKAESPLEP